MLTPEIEKEIIDQLVKSTSARNLIKKDTREYVDDDYLRNIRQKQRRNISYRR